MMIFLSDLLFPSLMIWLANDEGVYYKSKISKKLQQIIVVWGGDREGYASHEMNDKRRSSRCRRQEEVFSNDQV